ncbi:MAG: arylsulfotransferase family protein [Pseudomonadota bacterium]
MTNLTTYLFIAIYFTASNAFAYVGPGAGLGVIGVLLGILFALFLFIISIFWYPLKKMMKERKNKISNQENNICSSGNLFNKILFFFFGAMFIFIFNVADKTYNEYITENEKQQGENFSKELTVWKDEPTRMHDKVILLCGKTADPDNNIQSTYLVDNQGDILHQWDYDFNKLRKNEHYKQFKGKYDYNKNRNPLICVDSHLLPNGDVIKINSESYKHTFSYGSLVRLDKNSNVKWETNGNFHHEMEFMDENHMLVLDVDMERKYKHVDYASDYDIKFMDTIIKTININNGEIIKEYSIFDAFLNSKFSDYLTVVTNPVKKVHQTHNNKYHVDYLHVNDLIYVTKEKAASVDFLEEGDIFISFRHMDAVAVFRPSTNKIIWLKRGPWAKQHNIQLSDDGILGLIDNEGNVIITNNETGPIESQRIRVVEYDLNNDTSEILYRDVLERSMESHFFSSYDKLSDGTLLVTSSEQSRIIQVDRSGKIIWELRGLTDRDKLNKSYNKYLNSSRSYEKNFIIEPEILNK